MARRDLLSFTRFTFPGYRPAWHHRATADALNAVAEGKKKRVMLFEPPRHGKSELSSRRFPAYFLGRNPTKSFLSASYNNDFAADFGREVREIVASSRYRALFDVTLSADSKAANRWHTDKRGMYFAVGVGSATTGRGAHVLSIDDPLKNREEADSEIIREKVWRWYTSTAYTRLENDVTFEDLLDDDWLWREFQKDIEAGKAEPFEGAVVLTMTRWHDDDLAGRLLAQMERGGEQWEIIELPAIRNDENGDEVALWPQKYPLSRLRKIRDVIGPRDWSALYQQAPAPDEGLYFKREMFNWYDELPKHLRYYGASDYAVTANGGDYTVHGIGGLDPDENLYIVDVWRGQTESNVWIDVFCELIKRYKPHDWAEEQGQILKSLGPFIDLRMRELKAYCKRTQFVSVADKPTRARSFQARAAMGKVYLPRNAPWLADFLKELLSFPAGANDDQVDFVSLLGRLIDKMVSIKPKSGIEAKQDRWSKAFARASGGDASKWKVA